MSRLVVVGIGNPGPSYARTRHNAGAMVVERLAGELKVSLRRHRGQYRSADAQLGSKPVTLAIPTTFVNDSGRAVARLRAKVRGDLVVVHDELDLPLGRVRLKQGGGTAGHKGLGSIEAAIRSRDFLRVRVGIGRPDAGDDAVGKVLSAFRADELAAVDEAIGLAVEGLRVLASDGLDAAQRRLHAT